MFEDIIPKEDELELELEDLLEEETYELCPYCDKILVEGEECDCGGEDSGGCVGVGCLKA